MSLSDFASQLPPTKQNQLYVYSVKEDYKDDATAVFSNKADAERLADLLNKQKYEPEEYQEIRGDEQSYEYLYTTDSIYASVIKIPVNPPIPDISLPIWGVVIPQDREEDTWTYLKEVSYETLLTETFPQGYIDEYGSYCWYGEAATEREARELAFHTFEQSPYYNSRQQDEEYTTPSIYVEEVDTTVYIPSYPSSIVGLVGERKSDVTWKVCTQEEAIKAFGDVGTHVHVWKAVPKEN